MHFVSFKTISYELYRNTHSNAILIGVPANTTCVWECSYSVTLQELETEHGTIVVLIKHASSLKLEEFMQLNMAGQHSACVVSYLDVSSYE